MSTPPLLPLILPMLAHPQGVFVPGRHVLTYCTPYVCVYSPPAPIQRASRMLLTFLRSADAMTTCDDPTSKRALGWLVSKTVLHNVHACTFQLFVCEADTACGMQEFGPRKNSPVSYAEMLVDDGW